MTEAATGSPVKVLVVDDTATNRHILQVFLSKLGYEVGFAVDGAEAVEQFPVMQPDIVLMDVMMPVMDGFEATRRIKQKCNGRWVPVIFLSALDKEESLVTGLDAGGDDYLFKPISFTVLDAKLRSLRRTLGMQRALEAARQDLQRYRDRQEAENILAHDVMLRQMVREGAADPRVHQWLTPAANFSGDIVVAATSPGGSLYAMLADATGHGLSAAISALPVLSVFHGTVKRDLPLGTIVGEINRHLRATLPGGRFVAATLVRFDARAGRAEVWIGGMPPVLHVAADGRVMGRFDSRHVPLGVMEDGRAIAEVEEIACEPDSQFVLVSDGLLEAANEGGGQFGLERLEAAIGAAPAAQRLEAVREAFGRHVGAAHPHDDVSMMLLDCR
ncbi:MAG: PP2C family protein-serine/threonine phosphatase [Ignavibacteria bacterium]